MAVKKDASGMGRGGEGEMRNSPMAGQKSLSKTSMFLGTARWRAYL